MLQNSGHDTHTGRTLYVGGLDDAVTKDVLHSAFIPFGEIRQIEVPIDRASGSHRGFAFVEFEDITDAEHAVKNMHESELYGRVLTVNVAKPNARQLDRHKPIWADDFYYRQRLADEGLKIPDNLLDKGREEVVQQGGGGQRQLKL